MSKLQYLKRKEIDDQKWDELLSASVNSLPYAHTWYLDAVAENWDALVWKDYEVVMPIVWLRKWGVKCVYQPYYCQQLGFFSNGKIEKPVAEEMMAALRDKFSYIDMNLNPTAWLVSDSTGLLGKKNLLLDLQLPYNTLRKDYSENHRRNIARAEKAGFSFTTGVELKAFQNFYLANVDREKERFKPKHAKVFEKFTKALVSRNKAKIFAVINKSGQLVAAVLAISQQPRLITVINSSSAEGKKAGAAHFLFDCIIQNHAETAQVLDFEGSSIASIARFYEGFGAREEIFYNYKKSFLKR